MQVNNQWNQAAALVAAAILFTVGGVSPAVAQPSTSTLKGVGPSPNLAAPEPGEARTKFAEVVGWPENLAPKAPDGFQVEAFARDLDSPRWLYVLPNGDVLVSQARSHPRSSASADKRKGMAGAGSIGVSPNRITLLRDSDRDGRAEKREVFLTNLNQPLGVALIDNCGFPTRRDRRGLRMQARWCWTFQLAVTTTTGRGTLWSMPTNRNSTFRSDRPAIMASTGWIRRFAARTFSRSTQTGRVNESLRPGFVTRLV